jgi:endonuclease/exonuclease/phosphatase (EEP) superfamily protein YafD
MRPFRALLVCGYRDAATQLGAGLVRTFPADSHVPPLVGIDHVLTYQARATSMHTLRVSGSDHLALAATVGLARRPAPPTSCPR